MKNQIGKKIGIMLAGVTLVSSLATTPVFAASSVSGSLNGFEYTGRVSINDISATAVTTFGRGNATIRATATVYYWDGQKNYETSASNSNTAGGVSATATKTIGGADVLKGTGEHSVSYDAYSWGPVITTYERY